MKLTYLNLIAIALLSLSISACSNDDNDPNQNGDQTYDFTDILNDYVDNTVVYTYAQLKDEAKTLNELVVTFKETGLQTDLDAACQAWRNARVPWERSEAFLFGPAQFQSLDPLIDSWPLDRSQLEQVLAGSQTINANYVRDQLGAVLRGFHTIEYLLFRDGSPRTASEVTSREKDYLVAVTEVLRDDCLTLWASWHGSEGIIGEDAEILESLEVDAGIGFAYEFKKAGFAGSRYLSQYNAIDEVIQGCMDIADEVGNGKLADPYETKNTNLVESWHSWNSLNDFANNIRSIENAFYGGYIEGSRDNALIDFINEKDPTLEPQLKAKIKAAIDAINAIPAPFRNNLDKSEPIEAAMDAVNELNSFITGEIHLLLE